MELAWGPDLGTYWAVTGQPDPYDPELRNNEEGLLVTSYQQPTVPGKKENERRLQEGDSVQLSGEDMATWHMEEDLAKEHLSSTRFHEGVLLTSWKRHKRREMFDLLHKKKLALF